MPNKPRALLQKHAKAALTHRAGSRPRGNALRYLDRVAKGIAERLFSLTGASAAGAIEFSADYRLVREKHPSSTSTSSKTLPWQPAKLFGRNCAATTRP